MSTTEPNGTLAAEGPSKLRRWWPLIVLVVLAVVLIAGELAFQWARHRGWTTYTKEDGLADNHIQAMAVAPDGKLWIGTGNPRSPGCVVSCFDHETWTTYAIGHDLSGRNVRSVAVAPGGAVWVSTGDAYGNDDGVSRFDGQYWTTYTTRDGLADNRVFAIAVAPDGTVWFCTNYGVSSFDGESWTTYTKDDGLASDHARAVAVVPDGAVWFGTDDGVSGFDGEKWTTYTATDGLAGASVEVIAVAPDGTLWSAGAGGWRGNTYVSYNGVSRFDGETWTTYTAADGLLRNEVRAIAVSPDGALWFGTQAGVSRFDGERWTAYTSVNSGLAGNSVASLAVDDEGRVWIGTYDWGLSVVDQRAGLPAQTLQAWAQAREILYVVGIAVSALLVIIWIVRRFRAEPAAQWVLKGVVLVATSVGVGAFVSMIPYAVIAVLSIPGYEFGGKPPDFWIFAYAGMAVGGAIGFAVLIWRVWRQQRERKG